MNNIDSETILKSFLLSPAIELPNFKAIKALETSNIASSIIDQLILNNQERLNSITKNISDFNVPETVLFNKNKDTSNEDLLSLSSLINQLVTINKLFDENLNNLDQQIENEFETLQKSVGLLSDLKIGKKSFDEEVVKETLEELKEFENLIK